MNNKASLQLGGGNWAAKDASLLAYKTSLSEKSFLPIEFTFERGANLAGTRVDENGLIEKGRENLLEYSEEFDNPYYLKTLGTLTTNQTTAPDGSLTADLFTKTSGVDTVSELRANNVYSLTGIFTFSVYVKQNVGDGVLLRLDVDGNTANASFQFSTKSISTIGSNVIDATATELANGWFRLSVTGNVTNTSWDLSIVNLFSNPTNDSIFVWGAQLEQGLVATDYIETGASTAKAGVLEDLPRIDYTGGTPSLLLEPQRTNLIADSEYANAGSGSLATITDNVTTSPEGVQNAARLLPTSAFGRWESLTFGSLITNGTTYVVSAYFNTSSTLDIVTFYIGWNGATGADRIGIKFNPNTRAYISTFSEGSATLTDYDIGEADENGWYRISLIAPATNANSSTQLVLRDLNSKADGSKYVDFYGLQVEAGSYPTSYIPTYGAIATRGVDHMNNSAGIAQVGNNLSSGTWFVDFMKTGQDGSDQAIILAPLNNNTQQIRLHFDQNQNARFRDARNGYLTMGGSVTNTTSRTKMLVSVDSSAGIAKVFANGAQVGSNYTLGATSFEFSRILGYGKNFKLFSTVFFPEALSDAECITLTTL